MQEIGDELQHQTSIFSLSGPQPKILDLCTAPGGFLSCSLKHAPSHTIIRAITISEEDYGFRIDVKKDPRFRVFYADISMLMSEISPDEVIPADHLDKNILTEPPGPFLMQLWKNFDLVLCDGHVMRSRFAPSYWQQCEDRSLLCAQLIIALQRIERGGSMVVRLHRLHAFNTVKLIFQFDQFSTVRLFTPLKADRDWIRNHST